jgi:hypothetical protein
LVARRAWRAIVYLQASGVPAEYGAAPQEAADRTGASALND